MIINKDKLAVMDFMLANYKDLKDDEIARVKVGNLKELISTIQELHKDLEESNKLKLYHEDQNNESCRLYREEGDKNTDLQAENDRLKGCTSELLVILKFEKHLQESNGKGWSPSPATKRVYDYLEKLEALKEKADACPGCSVNTPHEHRCHGGACPCTDCKEPTDAELEKFKKENGLDS